MRFDEDRLREDIKQDCYGAFFGGGYGAALVEAMDADRAGREELEDLARSHGFDPEDYEDEDY